ncbi:hypothetical protein DN115_19200, partial [Salmonella enterica subsp. enterica]|nr:hypothetical protein [Salmonella enterica subsp. enterica serovar Chester]
NKVKLAWSKQLALTNTGLRVSWSHQSEEYEDMSSFNPAETWLQQNQGRRTRDEWNAGTLPLDTELSTTSRKVVPTDSAVV